MNLLTKFHEDRTVNVASRVKNALPLGSHTNLLTKFHLDWTINVASRGKCLAPGGHVFKATKTIFEPIQDIMWTNLLTKKNAPSLGSHVFQANVTKFHDDWAKIVTSGVFTRNTALPPGGHLHEDLASNVTSTVFTSDLVFDPVELSRSINERNFLTKFHEDRTINVFSRVFTRQNDKRRSQKLTMSTLCSGKCPSPCRPYFQQTGTIFQLSPVTIRTNVLTKFHKDWTINMTSRVFIRKNI
ncbi:hypothetical protein DPMN_194283 [Dreissena polymorpha]|uniref:Uncharacterized protein n=1 Tax=Dreissena polymorpha TaxID=45954 RepID=A0A9D3Y4G5_DREPO|nr:hypothetical protein DPMN_194283 [Dreissena polymorpha]